MTHTRKTPLSLAAILALAVAGPALSTPAAAQSLVLNKSNDSTPTHTAPTRGHGETLSANTGERAGKKDIWGDPDAFMAKCTEAGGGASTDEDGFPHCEDANGQNIPIPMEE